MQGGSRPVETALSGNIPPRRAHPAAVETHQIHPGFHGGRVIVFQAQPFEQRHLILQGNQFVPIVSLRGLVHPQFRLGQKIRHARREALNPHLITQMQHAGIVLLVANPNETRA